SIYSTKPPHTRIKRVARKTICFSRSIKVHEKAIDSFIESIFSTNWRHNSISQEIKGS
ncbi:IS1 family transposase, partial [Klebsiella pneumoniae]|uniref:IS1 family transposase n=1 Tax=Klebsiella pneumoniae TaxID=573 RepID=UPI001D0E5F35